MQEKISVVEEYRVKSAKIAIVICAVACINGALDTIKNLITHPENLFVLNLCFAFLMIAEGIAFIFCGIKSIRKNR